MNYKLVRLIPKPIKVVARELIALSMFSDLKSALAYFKIVLFSARSEDSNQTGTVILNIKQLGGKSFTVRRSGTDARVVFCTFIRGFHLPPKGFVSEDAKLILDLGANIGSTLAHYGEIYRSAKIIGVELDKENAELCSTNTSYLSDRAAVLNYGVWATDGLAEYQKIDGYQEGLSLVRESSDQNWHRVEVETLSINSLLEKTHCEGKNIDFVKMDIEGAESSVLTQNTEWSATVNCIMVEVHDEYDKETCAADLNKLGFKTHFDSNHSDCVIGIRQPVN